MSNQVVFSAARKSLHKLVRSFLATLDGIPDEDLNNWKPAAAANGGGEMNTLGALGVHTAEAAAWMIQQQTFGEDFDLSRVVNWNVVTSRDEIDTLFATMLARFDELVAANPDVNLSDLPVNVRPALPDWERAAWLMHALDHTAEHLGHIQITRQLWLAERNS